MPTTDTTDLTAEQVDKLTAALTAISAAVDEAILILTEDVTRASHCSCGRRAREVLPGGEHGPTGYCGIPGMAPLDPSDCARAEAPRWCKLCTIHGAGADAER